MNKILFFAFAFAVSTGVMAQKSVTIIDSIYNDPDKKNHVITGNDTSQVDWTTKYIVAKGWSIVDTTRFKIKKQAELMAYRGAVADAQRNLLERLKGVHVTSETTVQNFITQNDKVVTKIEGILKGAEMVGDYKMKDGAVEVTMQVPLYSDSAGIAANMQKFGKIKPFKRSGNNSYKSGNPTVLNIQGDYNPSLFPEIKDENGNLLANLGEFYDPSTGSFPSIVKNTAKTIQDYTKKGNVDMVDLIANKAGGLILNTKKFPKFQKVVENLKNYADIGKQLFFMLK